MDYLGGMDWQQVASLLIVAATAGLFLTARLRRRKAVWRRETHCGCGSGARPDAGGSIVFRARKGERRQIIVKSS